MRFRILGLKHWHNRGTTGPDLQVSFFEVLSCSALFLSPSLAIAILCFFLITVSDGQSLIRLYAEYSCYSIWPLRLNTTHLPCSAWCLTYYPKCKMVPNLLDPFRANAAGWEAWISSKVCWSLMCSQAWFAAMQLSALATKAGTGFSLSKNQEMVGPCEHVDSKLVSDLSNCDHPFRRRSIMFALINGLVRDCTVQVPSRIFAMRNVIVPQHHAEMQRMCLSTKD